MLVNEFVFENGVALLRSRATGGLVVYQPFNPDLPGGGPWDSAEQAEEWIQKHYYGAYYEDDGINNEQDQTVIDDQSNQGDVTNG
jgi:hypothetical protein